MYLVVALVDELVAEVHSGGGPDRPPGRRDNTPGEENSLRVFPIGV